jgi:hypothetical protein
MTALTQRPRFLIGRKIPGRLPKGLSRLRSRKMIHQALATTPAAEWVVSDQESFKEFLKEVAQQVGRQSARRPRLGNLALLKLPPLSSLAPAEAMFTRVAWAERWLLLPQLMEVLDAPNRRDLILGGTVDPYSQTLTVYRGDFSPITVSLSIFKPSGDGTKPDFDRFSIGNYGHSVCFGDYEAAADLIFYEGDPHYRKALKNRRRHEDKTFGACLRRLRMQRRLRQTDFAPLTARTIARIENNQVGKPRGKTLSIIARRLEVDPDAIETY